jgi:hypothetical protein
MTIKSTIKVFLDDLSVTDKVDILKELYKDISGLGVDGDTQLAHINSFEADLLRSVGGAGTLHMTTGLPQYKGGGGGGAPSAAYQNTSQTSRLSEEAAPFAKDVLTEAQDYYRGILNQGYDPYTGAVSAPQTQEQIDAQAGIKGLLGTGTALQQEGLDLYRQQGERFTPEVAAEYQSPYQQAVTDVEKRKAVEDFERNIMPQFESQAVKAGGMSGLGSRAGVQAGILGENLQTRLGDIQARGLQSSYMDAQKLFQDQKRREQGQAGAVAALGPASFGQGLAEQGAIQTVGEQRQALAQSALDEQYYKYLEQKAFPEEQLAKYSGFVYGNPLLSERDVKSVASAPGAQGPSFGAQILGAGAGLANTFGRFGQQQAGGANTFGQPVRRAAGGGGLSDIVYRQENGQISTDTRSPARVRIDRLAASLEEQRLAEEKRRKDGFDASLVKQGLEWLFGSTPEAAQNVEAKRKALQTERKQAGQAGIFSTGNKNVAKPATAVTANDGLHPAWKKAIDKTSNDTSAESGTEATDYSELGIGVDPDISNEQMTIAELQASLAAPEAPVAAISQADSIKNIYAQQGNLIQAFLKRQQRRREANKGTVDRRSIFLEKISSKLLESKPGDPRDPESTRAGLFLRLADGVESGNIAIREAEDAFRKLETASINQLGKEESLLLKNNVDMLKQLAKLRDPATMLKQRDKINKQIMEWVEVLLADNYNEADRAQFVATIQPLISKLQEKYPTVSGSTIIAEIIAHPSMAKWAAALKITPAAASERNPNSKPSSTAGTAAATATKAADQLKAFGS